MVATSTTQISMSSLAQNDAFATSGNTAWEQRKENFISFFFGGIRRSAVIETFVFFTAAVLLNLLFGDGARFISMNPHPFWIIILLVIVQYGQREAVFTALLATAFLLLGNMPEQSMTETMYDYYFRIFLQPLLWIITALVLGSIRSRQFRERDDLFERLWKSEESAHILASSYLALKKAKERLELRLAEETRSVLTVCQMAKAIQSVTSETLLDNIETLVTTSLHPAKFSVFWLEGQELVLAKSVGWKADDAFATRFGKNSTLMQDLVNTRRVLSVVEESHEKILGHEGVLAGPLFDEKTKALIGLLKIEDMDFIDMGINAHETFKILCDWISLAHACADKHQKIQRDESRMPGKSLICISSPAPTIEIVLPEFLREPPSELSKPAC